MSVLLPKSLLSRLSVLVGLGAPPVEEEEKKEGDGAAQEEEALEHADNAAPSPPLPPAPLDVLDDQALTLSLDPLPPRDLAALSLASRRLRSVASDGDAWRLRFDPRLPKGVVARLDGGAVAPASGWPRTYAALALSNLLRSPLEWEGVGLGMRAATVAASEASASSPAWRVTCHGGHGWDVERGGPAGSDEFPVAATAEGGRRWPPALMPRSALASSRAGATAAPSRAPSSSWLPRSLLPPPPGPRRQQQRPLCVASSFSWCELVQEVDLVFELLRATSWVSSSSSGSSSSEPTRGGGGGGAGEKEAKNDCGDGKGGDGKGKNGSSSGSSSNSGSSCRSSSSSGSSSRSSSRKKTSPSLCWTRQDAETYLDSSPALVLSFSCASRGDCESSLSASLLALPALEETGPLPPYHGRARYDWSARAQALASSELQERAAPWGEGGSRAGTWERATLPPLRLPPGARRALVVLRSRDSRFWSGHYGAKLAAPVLAFAATDREIVAAEEAARETERGREAAAAGRELLFAA